MMGSALPTAPTRGFVTNGRLAFTDPPERTHPTSADRGVVTGSKRGRLTDEASSAAGALWSPVPARKSIWSPIRAFSARWNDLARRQVVVAVGAR